MESNKDTLSGALILIIGLLTLGTSLYFLASRPPLLPEDIRYTGIDTAVLPPAFMDWLAIVFKTWAGFIAGFGIVLLGIGAFMLTGRVRWLRWATAIGVVTAFGRFFFSNVVLASDFLWFISALLVLACGTAVLLVLNRTR